MNHFSFLFSPTAKALGHSLLYSLWQAFIVFICLRLILRLIPNASARIKYSLSYFAYLGIAAWFVITLFHQLPLAQNELAFRVIIGQNALQQTTFEQTTSISGSALSFSYLNNYLPWIVGFYLLGIVWFMMRLVYNYFHANTLKTSGLIALDASWQQRIVQLADTINIHQKVRAYFSRHVDTPMMIGFFKPVILLPLATMNHLSVQQFEAILLHELAHIRRNDYFLNLLQSIVDTILFFNPFTWWITKNIRDEREKCCDEMVLQLSDPYHYARALLALEEPLRNRALVMTAVGEHSQLLHRIKNIMEMKNNHINLRQKFVVFLVIAVASISVAWLSPRETRANPQTPLQIIGPRNSPGVKVLISNYFPLKPAADSVPKEIEPLPPVVPLALNPPVPNPPAPQLAPLPPPLPPINIAVPTPMTAPLPPLPALNGMRDSLPPSTDYFNSKEWKKQQEAIKKSTAEIQKYFQSDVWKKQQQLIQKNSLAMKKYFNSPEWKKQQKEIQKSAAKMHQYFKSDVWEKQQAEIQKNASQVQKYFNSPEWKKQQEEIKRSADSISFYFKSDAWKKQQENMKKAFAQTQKYFESAEWKKQQEELKKAMMEVNKEMRKDAESKKK
jgi:beta-lactamase regulating signal transducer with metallopeptidase domain